MKKMMFLVLSLMAVMTYSSCDKDDCLTGTVRITNNANSTYDIYIDDVYQLKLDVDDFVDFDLIEGDVDLKAIQSDVWFPFTYEETKSVYGCQTTQWIFP